MLLCSSPSSGINWFSNLPLSKGIFHPTVPFSCVDHTECIGEWTWRFLPACLPANLSRGKHIRVVQMANGINICSAFFLSFGCLSWEKNRETWKKSLKTLNRREHQRDARECRQKRQTDEMKKSATGREKYVKINWKSIECDVKIKFTRAATSAEIAMGIYFVDSRGRIGRALERIFFRYSHDRVNNFWRVDGECDCSCVKISLDPMFDTSFFRCRFFCVLSLAGKTKTLFMTQCEVEYRVNHWLPSASLQMKYFWGRRRRKETENYESWRKCFHYHNNVSIFCHNITPETKRRKVKTREIKEQKCLWMVSHN